MGLNYFDEENDFSASITMRNVGAQLKRFDDRTEHLPFDLDVGFTQSMAHAPVRLSLTLTDLTRWSSKYYFNESGKECSFGRILFNHFVIGVDVIPTKFLYLSAGYNARRAYELKAAGSGKEPAGRSAEDLNYHASNLEWHTRNTTWQPHLSS